MTAEVTRFKFNPQYVYQPPDHRGLISWWIELGRDGFTQRCKQEEPRMRSSRAYQLVGNPQVIGQLDRQPQ